MNNSGDEFNQKLEQNLKDNPELEGNISRLRELNTQNITLFEVQDIVGRLSENKSGNYDLSPKDAETLLNAIDKVEKSGNYEEFKLQALAYAMEISPNQVTNEDLEKFQKGLDDLKDSLDNDEPFIDKENKAIGMIQKYCKDVGDMNKDVMEEYGAEIYKGAKSIKNEKERLSYKTNCLNKVGILPDDAAKWMDKEHPFIKGCIDVIDAIGERFEKMKEAVMKLGEGKNEKESEKNENKQKRKDTLYAGK